MCALKYVASRLSGWVLNTLHQWKDPGKKLLSCGTKTGLSLAESLVSMLSPIRVRGWLRQKKMFPKCFIMRKHSLIFQDNKIISVRFQTFRQKRFLHTPVVFHFVWDLDQSTHDPTLDRLVQVSNPSLITGRMQYTCAHPAGRGSTSWVFKC